MSARIAPCGVAGGLGVDLFAVGTAGNEDRAGLGLLGDWDLDREHAGVVVGGQGIDVEGIAEVLAPFTPFEVTFARLDRFPGLLWLAPEPSEGSMARLARLQELLERRAPAGPEDVMEIMRDHGSSPQAICLHPDPAEGDEASACMFSMVADLGARRMWVAIGNPCEHDYDEIDLTELAS